MQRRFSSWLAASALFVASTSAYAVDFTVRVVNLTNGLYFTPLLVAAHTEDSRLFTSGEAASPEIQAMAEGGDISGLEGVLASIDATVAANPAGGLLAPTASATAALNTDGTSNTRLTVVAMMLPTNDAFIGLNAVAIPEEAGTYVFNVPAYDSGTEANDEIVNGGGAPGVPGIPAAPGGSGTGASGASTADANSTVHIHRGAIGDTDPTGGVSDLDATVHRWLNPVARVIVTVN